MFIAGGVILSATVLYWLWPRGSSDDETGLLLPAIGPTGAGLTYSGSF